MEVSNSSLLLYTSSKFCLFEARFIKVGSLGWARRLVKLTVGQNFGGAKIERIALCPNIRIRDVIAAVHCQAGFLNCDVIKTCTMQQIFLLFLLLGTSV